MRKIHKKQAWSLGEFLHLYFGSYMINQKGLSPNTVASYRDGWKYFLQYLQREKNVSPSSLQVSDMKASDIVSYLDHAEAENGRKNCIATRNNRLAALRSPIRYALKLNPTLPPHVHQIMAIPLKKRTRRVVAHLNQEEMDGVLLASSGDRWSERRDHVMLLTYYNTGARVSELCRVKVNDVILERPGRIRIHGKGRKEREIPLLPSTLKKLRRWISMNGLSGDQPLFPNAKGRHITRSGVSGRLKRWVKVASATCPSMNKKKISPHVIRHTTAMHMLEAGEILPVIALWLGHERIETTNMYLSANLPMKERALSRLNEPGVPFKRYKATDELLSFLDSL